jgi:hypothetical protein
MSITDPNPVQAQPLILNNGYFELTGTNLRCLVTHLEVSPENSPVTITSMCAEIDYPGSTKWHLRVTFSQSFDAGATFDVLKQALDAYNAGGTAAPFKARAYAARPISATNPQFSGLAIPQPFDYIIGDAGAASTVAIDWNLLAEPDVDNGTIAATSALAGEPGYFLPPGALLPANRQGLTGITANPTTAWAEGQYVITADLLAAHWDGSAWDDGKAPAP